MSEKAALYMRVSTKKQAEQDISIPDQKRQLEAYCKSKGWEIVGEYEEPGASAMTMDRAVFQRMLSEAHKQPAPFNYILVHSYSRFARDAVEGELEMRRLEKHGVSVRSITQEVGDTPGGSMIRHIMGVMDEHNSRETAKHTLRGMEENARQGFWNGSHPPYGYVVIDAEKRGPKTKKKLAINRSEAGAVREIFRLYISGTGRSGPMGTKRIVTHLNGRGRRQRNGKPFSISFVHKVLRNTCYVGTHYFNRKDSRAKKPKSRDQWVAVTVPTIVDRSLFQSVQKRLDEHNPKKTPSRTVTNAILLGGLVKCGCCGGGMTLRAGKSGRYRYYACSNRARVGAVRCKGNVLPMPKLDDLVTDTLLARVLAPDRVEELVREVRRAEKQSSGGLAAQLRELNARERETSAKVDKLIRAIEDGVPSERLHERLRELEANLQETRDTKRGLQQRTATNDRPISAKEIARATSYFQRLLRDGELPLRKAYLRLFIDTIEVRDGEIIITGSKRAAAKAIETTSLKAANTVPVYIRDWRPRRDLNARPPD